MLNKISNWFWDSGLIEMREIDFFGVAGKHGDWGGMVSAQRDCQKDKHISLVTWKVI